ncbi:hypothetical protein GCM10011583_51290 [Streptomyces camponoticapitis]|uniref:Uncharacterized protein n=1 Tax=Streptomyces camponoticapitis TaxID=1616125 RepID=A0ABQ2EJ31_9ACTN|nr:hypothetical protein [Streptomyces camponoticapitis]GGK13071.1 hypothetical protein GCM10011583_51290 [Streptomyces camponoticapitis]
MDPYANAREELHGLLNSPTVGSGANEDTTRLHLIDALLFNCLGWSPQEAVTEDHHNGSYVDYLIGKPAAQFILEAKKEGIAFDLPPGIAGRHAISVPTLMEDENTAKAIRQVLGYCQERGIPIGIISNGHQLAAFFASRQDGVPPLKGNALVFSSLQEMHDDFQTLWGHLSKPAFATRSLQRYLLAKKPQVLAPEKLANSINNYPGFRRRTELETDLKMLGQLFIQDLEHEKQISDEFVKDCYCASGALSQYSMVSREVLRARYASVAENVPGGIEQATAKKGINPKLTTDMVTAALSRRPIILLGDVGVGKSMFLRHLIRVDAKEVLAKSIILYVDFVREPVFVTDLPMYITERMTEQLETGHQIDIQERGFVRAVYNKEINKFKRTILGDESDPTEYRKHELIMLTGHLSNEFEHLRRSLEHIKATSGRSPLVILDNIDQRPPEFQESIFESAHSIADSWPGTVFVSIRPSTFFQSRAHGALAAYQTRVFTIAPARTDQVVSKRLEFARNKVIESGADGAFPNNLSINDSDLIAYLDALIRAFKIDEELKSLIDNMSGGNTRTALLFLFTFIGSGYVSTQRVLDVAEGGRVYKVPMHEFIRAIVFGDYDYFNPEASAVCNLFDITTNDGREHFLLPSILAHVQRSAESAGSDGLVPAVSIYSFGQGLGFSQEQVGAQLDRATKGNLLVFSDALDGGSYRPTSVGSYLYRKMIHSFSYVDAMIVDTPIVNPSVRRGIGDVHSIKERLQRAKAFRAYLDSQWTPLETATGELPFRWNEVSAILSAEIADAERKADAAIQRRADSSSNFWN